jgi:hypothetical protein
MMAADHPLGGGAVPPRSEALAFDLREVPLLR